MSKPVVNPAIQVTDLLGKWRIGDRAAESELLDAVYPWMKMLAQKNVQLLASGAFGVTEIANEVFIKLKAQQGSDWKNRAHFLAVIATATRNVVIDLAREASAAKRGGSDALNQRQHVRLEFSAADERGVETDLFSWLALDQALHQLASEDSSCAKVAELKLFSTMEADEIGEVCEISTATVGRHWRFAKAWLGNKLELSAPL